MPDKNKDGESGKALEKSDDNTAAVDETERLKQILPDILAEEFSVQTQTSHSGPLPDPETLHQYETIMPGLAERIFPDRKTSKHTGMIWIEQSCQVSTSCGAGDKF